MKKLYKEEKHKNWISHRQENHLKRKLKKDLESSNIFKNDKKIRKTRKNLYQNLKNKKVDIISFPENFSIINNPYELTLFYKKVRELFFLGKPLYFDKKNVQDITLDSLLYMIALLDYVKLKNVDYFFSGNYPLNSKCREIFINSGFLNYVKQKNNELKFNDKYFQIISGNIVDNLTAKNISIFISKHLNRDQSYLRGIYRIIIELMNNTKEHAYDEKHITSKWYIIAYYDKLDSKVNFSFLDTGVGIPQTINKNHMEWIMQNILPKFGIDSFLIESSLKGEFRTKTYQGFRGKGLPCIYDFSKNEYIKDLKVISNFGYVDCSNNDKINLNNKFHGTLYTWSFS